MISDVVPLRAFEYPRERHIRRHGPKGYNAYESFRPWLRDEFTFRCVYCLDRERWTRSTFHLDHVVPQAIRPEKSLEYDNLVYSCAKCNLAKGGTRLPLGPDEVAFGQALKVEDDGRIVALTPVGESLRDVLLLDSDENTGYRARWLHVLRILFESERELYRAYMGFPDDLPDLSARHPKSNTRPEGVAQSWYAKRAKGELPSTY